MNHEAGEAEWVVVENESTAVAEDLTCEAEDHGDGEPVCAPFDELVCLHQESQEEDDEENDVCWEGWAIAVDAVGCWAEVGGGFVENAVGIRTVGYQIRGVDGRHGGR